MKTKTKNNTASQTLVQMLSGTEMLAMIETYAQQYKVFKLSDLKPFAGNSRTHSEKQLGQIKKSIKEFGFTNPLIISLDKTILAGHGRFKAALELGLTELPCIIVNGLTDAQKRAYVIADNQIALNAGWDMDLLQFEVDELKALDFDVDLLALDSSFNAFPDDPTFEPDESDYDTKPEKSGKLKECPSCGYCLN